MMEISVSLLPVSTLFHLPILLLSRRKGRTYENHRCSAVLFDTEKCPNIADWESQDLGHDIELHLHIQIYR